MSSPSNTAFSYSTFETFFNSALEKYAKQTGKDLRNHTLASEIDGCNSPDSILHIFQGQARAFDEFKRGDTKLFKWLRSIVNVLHALSTNEAIRDSVAHVSPTRTVIIHSVYLNSVSTGVSAGKGCFLWYRGSSIREYLPPCLRLVLRNIRDCQEAKYVRASYDALIDIFECVENFLRRLSIYTEIPLTPAMTEMVIKIMVELLSVLALATKQINRGRFSTPVFAYSQSSLICGREIREKISRRKGYRISPTKAR